MADRVAIREMPYGTVAEFAGHRIVTMSPNSPLPRSLADRIWTVYVLAGHVVCEFQYPGGKNEQVGVQAGQWVEVRQGVAFSLRTRGASILAMVDEEGHGDSDT